MAKIKSDIEIARASKIRPISEVLKKTLNVSKEDVYCLFRETPAHNHYTGVEPLPEWVPSDE